MEEIDVVQAAQSALPMWLNVFLGIVGAVGGLEFVKWIASLDIWRKKGKAEAKKEEAQAKQEDNTAAQQQADLVSTQIETSKQMLEQMKQHNEYQAELIKSYEQEKLEDRKIKHELRLEVTDLKRQVLGIQEALTREVSIRKATERMYCSNEACKRRKPTKGTYSADNPPEEKAFVMRPRSANGQFVKMA